MADGERATGEVFPDPGSRPFGFADILVTSVRASLHVRLPELLLLGAAHAGIQLALVYAWAYPRLGPFLDRIDLATFPDYVRAFAGLLPFCAVSLVVSVTFLQYGIRRMHQAVTGSPAGRGETVALALDPLRLIGFAVTGTAAGILTAAGTLFCIVPGLVLGGIFALLPACLTLGPGRLAFPIAQPFRLLRGRVVASVGALFLLCVPSLTISTFVSALYNFWVMAQDMANTTGLPMDPSQLLLQPESIAYTAANGLLTVLLYIPVSWATVLLYENYRAFPIVRGSPAGSRDAAGQGS